MRALDAAWLSGTNLLKNPMRTLLTILGLGVGVAAVLTVVTLGTAGQVQVEREIDKLGVDKVWITAEPGADSGLDAHSADRVSTATGAQTCATATTVGIVTMGDKAVTATLMGYDESTMQVQGVSLTAGRSFTRREYQEGAAVALVDETLQQSLPGDVVGQRLMLGSRAVTVVGVMHPVAAQASNGMVVLPLKTLTDTCTEAEVTQLTLSVPGDCKAETVATMALDVLGDGYQATTLQEEIDAARSVIRIFVMVLASVAAVCMVTGGVGVMNILLVSVRERRREIGLMKAVGGTSGQVAVLFLLEAVSYALSGGVLGLILGAGMIALFGHLIGLEAHLTAGAAIPTLLSAALLGGVFGVVPAVKASAMQPVDALRQE